LNEGDKKKKAPLLLGSEAVKGSEGRRLEANERLYCLDQRLALSVVWFILPCKLLKHGTQYSLWHNEIIIGCI
jgi:hypothetical protein